MGILLVGGKKRRHPFPEDLLRWSARHSTRGRCSPVSGRDDADARVRLGASTTGHAMAPAREWESAGMSLRAPGERRRARIMRRRRTGAPDDHRAYHGEASGGCFSTDRRAHGAIAFVLSLARRHAGGGRRRRALGLVGG